jgi:hypothetical protein
MGSESFEIQDSTSEREWIMNEKEIISEVQELLELHRKKVLGYMGQEPYKGDFFNLFKSAYKGGFFYESSSPRLTGDAFRDILVTRWLSGDSNSDAIKEELMDQLFTMWDEWRYAWDKDDR